MQGLQVSRTGGRLDVSPSLAALPRSWRCPRLSVLCRLYHIIYLQMWAEGGDWEGVESGDVQHTAWITSLRGPSLHSQPARSIRPSRGAAWCAAMCTPLPSALHIHPT